MPEQPTEAETATPWIPEPALDPFLIEEAAKKSALIWVSPSGAEAAPPQALWHVWHEGAVTVVVGGAEQPLPPYALPGRVVEVGIRSKDNGARLITWLSQVEALAPGTPEWDAAAAALHAERLNLPEGDKYLDRWAAESAILRLRPLGSAIPPDGSSGAARPAPTGATTLNVLPKMVGGVPRKKRDKKR